VRELSRLPHANVTTVPFHVGRENGVVPVGAAAVAATEAARPERDGFDEDPTGDGDATLATRIGEARSRRRARVEGRVRAVRVEPMAGSPILECTVVDDTGTISVVFFGRRQIAGIGIGTLMTVEGMVIEHRGRLAIVNPVYQLH
jgi:RecG-like helicase